MLSLRPTKTDNVLKALRNNELGLVEHINQVEEHFKGREPQVLSFIPEEGRFDRLRREAESLVDKYPQPGDRPELFGMLILNIARETCRRLHTADEGLFLKGKRALETKNAHGG